MFGWFQARCPVEPEIKRWIEGRLGWLLEQFGPSRLVRTPVVLPSDEYFPTPYDGSENAARALFAQTCAYMDYDPQQVDLEFYLPGCPPEAVSERAVRRPGSFGLYLHREGERPAICVDRQALADPESLVAIYAHELAHAHLVGDGRVPGNSSDLELLADLTTIFLGLGVLAANAAVLESIRRAWHGEGGRRASGRCLAPEAWGYAMALFAWLREERDPAWRAALIKSVRTSCRQGLKYLWETGDVRLNAQSPPGMPINREEETAEASECSGCEAVPACGADCHSSDENHEEPFASAADALFTQGIVCAQGGRWQEAANAFSQAIEAGAGDAEAYQERAWAYFHLGRISEALADAEEAVRLEPDQADAYCVRGIIHGYARHLDQALADLDYYLVSECSLDNPYRAAHAFYTRATVLSDHAQWRKAIKDLAAAIRLWPTWPAPYEARAAAYDQLGRADEARADRAEALRRVNP